MSGVEARSGPVWADRVREQAGLSGRERRWRRVGLRRASGLQARREREGKLGPRGVWVGFPGQFGLSLAGLGFSFFSLLIQTKLKLILFEFKFEFEFKTLALKQSENHAPA